VITPLQLVDGAPEMMLFDALRPEPEVLCTALPDVALLPSRVTKFKLTALRPPASTPPPAGDAPEVALPLIVSFVSEAVTLPSKFRPPPLAKVTAPLTELPANVELVMLTVPPLALLSNPPPRAYDPLAVTELLLTMVLFNEIVVLDPRSAIPPPSATAPPVVDTMFPETVLLVRLS
jgi:hypothetical protein